MTALSETVIKKFCNICNWAYDAWCINRTLFELNPNIEELEKGNCGEFFDCLRIITKEYALHQLVKLHDLPIMGGNICLTIGYIVDYGGWEKETYNRLKSLHKNMEDLSNRIKPARNKVLSHNDMKTIISDSTLGDFKKGEDVKYFKNLQDFVNIVHDKCIGGPFPFGNKSVNNCEKFLDKILTKNPHNNSRCI